MQHYQRRITALCALAIALLPALSARAEELLALRGARIETVSKAGAIENGILLVRNGKIEAVGQDIDIPVSAQIIDVHGMTIMPGLVDPYFVVSIDRNTQPDTTRTVVFGGRTFVIPGGSPAIATTFARLADGLNLSDVAWDDARRSGITTLHLVTSGYAQSMLAQPASSDGSITESNGKLLTAVTNETKSLDVLRNGLKEPRADSNAGASRGRPTTGGSTSATDGSTSTEGSSRSAGSGTSAASQSSELWQAVREGKSPLFLNVNNAAAILHALAATKDSKNAKVVFIASGEDVFRTLDEFDPKLHSLLLAPRIDSIPNSRDRVNVPHLLAKKKIPFAFSPSLGQSDFRAQLDTPLFAVGMLVRYGLDRQTALESCTITPAKLLGMDGEIGTLEVGKRANFIVLDGDPFATRVGIRHIFIDGKSLDEK